MKFVLYSYLFVSFFISVIDILPVAVALNYGIFRRKDFNETAQYIMFYDMGATSTSAAIVSYQLVKTKEKGYVETSPQLSIIGVG
jgi:hypoxia up-regulated 1